MVALLCNRGIYVTDILFLRFLITRDFTLGSGFIIDLTLVAPCLERSTKRKAALLVHLKIMIFYATWIFQITVGDIIHVRQNTSR